LAQGFQAQRVFVKTCSLLLSRFRQVLRLRNQFTMPSYLTIVIAAIMATLTAGHVAATSPKTQKQEVKIDDQGKIITEPAEEKAHEGSSMVRSEEKNAPAKHFEFDEGEADEVALDELEAMTIASMLLKKHWSPPPARNCKWGPWKKGKCDKTCGIGEVESIRSKRVEEAHGGTCEGKDTKKEVCNAGDCPPPPTPAPTTVPPTLPPQAFASRMSAVSLLSLISLVFAVKSSFQ